MADLERSNTLVPVITKSDASSGLLQLLRFDCTVGIQDLFCSYNNKIYRYMAMVMYMLTQD